MSAVESLIAEAKRIHADVGDDPFVDHRVQALEQFSSKGFPTLKNEHWKYTDVRRIAKKSYVVESDSVQVSQQAIDAVRIKELNCHELIFINGVLQSSLSYIDALPKDVNGN